MNKKHEICRCPRLRFSSYRLILALALIIVCQLSARGVRYHCAADSAAVMEIVRQAASEERFGSKVVAAARALKDIPLAKSADNDTIGTVVVRLDSLSPTEFINICLAAARTANLSSPSITDFEKNLVEVSRKKGVDNGFLSRFLYGSEWIVDNIYRGNLKEMTEYLPGSVFSTVTLDYVGRHPEEFPALSNPDNLDKVKQIEFSLRSHRIPYMKKHAIGSKNVSELMEDGDILMLLSPASDYDLYDIGVVVKDPANGQPHLIHILKTKNMVVEDPYPLSRLTKIEGQFFNGFRWLRPQE